MRATWFVDPPYQGSPGDKYVDRDVNYAVLGRWCRERSGQVVVCENEGADWLPFRPFGSVKSANVGKRSVEVVWTNDR